MVGQGGGGTATSGATERGGFDRLRAARPHDVWLAHDVSPERIERVWVDGTSVAWTSTHPLREVRWLTAVCDDAAAGARLGVRALQEAVAAGLVVSGTTVDADVAPLLPAEHAAPRPDRWSWWWTRRAPRPRPGEADVRAVGDDDARLVALLAHSPSVYVFPGDRRVRSWRGVERDGALVSCGAHVQHQPGVPHLASVVTHPGWRGRGLAADVCARLTRDALDDGFAIVTLGMYVGNVAAQRVYEGLGFHCERTFASGYLPGQSPPGGAPPHDALPADAGGTG